MNRIFLAMFAIILTAGCKGVMPEIDNTYVPDIKIEDLAAKMVTAVDPNGTYRDSKSYYMRQEIKLSGKIVSYEVLFKSPDKFRTVMSMDNKVLQKITCNGIKCWSVSENGEKTEIKGKELDRLKLLDDMSSAKGTMLDFFDKVEFAGEAKVYDSPCYVLICYPKTKELEPIAKYVNKTDFLTRKVVTLKEGKPYVAEIKRYALVKGVMIATETEMDINNDGKKELLTVVDYRLNMDIQDKEFE